MENSVTEITRAQELEQKLFEAKHQYYLTGKSFLTDDQYDAMEDELYTLNPNSRIFTMVGTDAGDIDLIIPALSTFKALNDDELVSYWNRFNFNQLNEDFVVSIKIDGMASSLEYHNGILVQAATRGNGLYGKSFMDKVQFMNIPKTISNKDHVIIRGEIFMPNANFEKFNQILEETKEQKQANPRNSTSGLLNAKQITRAEDKLPLLSFLAYGFYTVEDSFGHKADWVGDFDNYETQLIIAKRNGFTPVPYRLCKKDEINRALADKMVNSVDFPADGIVVRPQSNTNVKNLGHNNKAAFGIVAIKPKGKLIEVMIKDIEWSQGTKEFTPVAIIEPTYIQGATVTRVSLHSVKNMLDLDAVPGKTIKLTRSGMVIPRAYHRETLDL